jgi:hypothetical protein
MKHSNEIIINLPRKKVLELFDSTENLYKWQKSLKNFEHLSGVSGEVGAKSKLTYKEGKRDFVLIETITVKNLPDEFSGTYETKDIYNEIKNYFIEIDENTTKWVSESEFTFSGFMKIISFLMAGSFKKESMKYLKYFKEFAEKSN